MEAASEFTKEVFEKILHANSRGRGPQDGEAGSTSQSGLNGQNGQPRESMKSWNCSAKNACSRVYKQAFNKPKPPRLPLSKEVADFS